MKFVLKFLVILLFTPTLFVRCAQEQKQKKQPNFLFILVDDESPFDLKMYESTSTLDTPNLDELASEGMVFESARHMGSMNGAVCTPSRHMIMSGRTVWHLPASAGKMEKIICPTDLPDYTIGAVFNKAGYSTMRTCKKGNSYAAANKKFSVLHEAVKRGGTEETGSAWHAKQVLNYLNDRIAKKDKKPFFIYYGFSHPHDPRNGTPELLKKYGAVNFTNKDSVPPANPKQPKLPVTYLPAHPFFMGHPNLRDEERVSGVWKHRDENTIRNEMGREYACVENIDIQIGKVLTKLKEMGELGNTYIIYASDHGISIGKHGLMGKQNLYEHTWRIPFIVKGPGISAGQRVEGNIYLLDVFPTLCDLAGIKIPQSVEGKSFKPVLEGKEKTIRDVMYGAYAGGTKPGIRSVKKGDWKLIQWDVMDGSIQKLQLFNLAENPYELLKEHQDPKVEELTGNIPNKNQVNLAYDPKYADKLKEMEDLLQEQMKKYDDPYPLWNQIQK